MTLRYTNYCQLYIAFMQILIITHHLKFEKIFWISQKHLTKYWMKVYYTNLNLLVFQKIWNLFCSFLNDRYIKVGIKYLTRLRLGLSHLNEHKFRQKFQDCLNSLCACSLEVEKTNHFFLHCHYHNGIRKILLDTVKKITKKCLSDFSDEALVNLPLYGNSIYSLGENKEVIKAFINVILSSQRFAGALM